MPLTDDGKKLLLDPVAFDASLTLIATYNTGGAPLTTSQTCDYDNTATDNGDGTFFVDITSDVTFTLPSSSEVTKVSLNDGTGDVAEVSVTTENTFPNGGDYIIKSYKVKVG
jgi:hypothetical protein